MSSEKPGLKELFRLTPLVLFSLLLLVVYACEIKSPPQKVGKERKPAETTPVETKPAGINMKETMLVAIPQDYEKWGDVSFSADGRQVFYQAEKEGLVFIVVASTNGENIGPAYKSVSFFVRSPDGRRFAFGGEKGGKSHLVVDNKELKDLYHEEVAPGAFSPDNRFVACEVGGGGEKKWFVLVSDGEKEIFRSPVYPDTWRAPVFSPDGRLLVYELGDDKRKIVNEKDTKRTIFFLDVSSGKVIKERLFTGYRVGKVSFSSDSSRVAYDVQKENNTFLVLNDFAVNEERTVELPYSLAGQVGLSPDGKQILYIATKKEKPFLVVSPWKFPEKREEFGPYDAVVPPIFGPDGKTFAYHSLRKGKWRIMAGDKKGASYDGFGDATVFSPDARTIAYPAMKKGKWSMVVSWAGRPAAVNEGPVYDMVVTPVFSPDGQRIAYRVRTGPKEKAKRFMVVADVETGKIIKEGQIGDEIWPPVWSTDGKTVGYGARHGRELWWRVERIE